MFQHCCHISVAISGDLILYLSLSKYSQVFQICTSQNVCVHQVSHLCLLTVNSYSELSPDICNDMKEQWTLFTDLQTDSSYYEGEDSILISKMTIWSQSETLFRCKFQNCLNPSYQINHVPILLHPLVQKNQSAILPTVSLSSIWKKLVWTRYRFDMGDMGDIGIGNPVSYRVF